MVRGRSFRFALAAGFILCCAAPVHATDSRAQLGVDNVHGAPEFLRDSLVQSSDEAREVAAAVRLLSLGDQNTAFAALQNVLARPHDEFTTMFPGRPSTSTYRAAFEVLRTADFSTRAAWANAMSDLAEVDLQRAVAARDSAAILKVARNFPFTRPGLKALAISAAAAWRRGQPALARALVRDMTFTYEQTRVPFRSSATLRAIRSRIGSAGAAAKRGQFAPNEQSEHARELTLPWPEPLWAWQESLWEAPQAAAAVSVLAQPENRALLGWNSWSPAIVNNTVLLRTPTTLFAFDKLSGTVQWSMATDTVTQRQQSPDSERALLTGEDQSDVRISVTDLLHMDDWGSVTIAGNNLYFVDHYRRLQLPRGRADHASATDNLLRNYSMEEGGRRLVCLQLQKTPQVIWTVGDAPSFRYSVVNGAAQRLDAPPTREDDALEPSEFAGHRFLGPPLAHDGHLFLLTADKDETTWLNCLAASTGRRVWRKPIAREPQSRNLYGRSTIPRTGASVCGVDGDVVVCQLRSGVMVGTRLIDGQLLWATNFREAVDGREYSGFGAVRRIYRAVRSPTYGSRFKPLLHNGRIVWSTPDAHHIQCVDSHTGRILWRVSKEAEATGHAEGSLDHYAAGAWQDQVVMVGSRHVRWLSVEDGRQLAFAEADPQSGRASCAGPTCLVPLLDGSLELFDARTGTSTAWSRDISTSAPSVRAGSVTCDPDVICFSTPTSIEVLPSHQLVKSRTLTQPTDDTKQLTLGKMNLLAGKTSDGVAQLHALLEQINDGQSSPDFQAEIETLLAETVLQQMEQIRSNAYEPGQSGLPSPDLTLLRDIKLTHEQQLRLLLLGDGNRTSVDREAFADIDLIRMSRDLQVRPDLAAHATLSMNDARQIAEFAAPDSTDYSKLELAILFPQQIGNAAEQVAYADFLAKRSLYSAAELFLVSALRSAEAADREPLLRAQQSIRKLVTADTSQPHSPQHVTATAQSVKIEEEYLFAGSLAGLAKVRPKFLKTPDWYPHRLALFRRDLHAIDMVSGAVSIPIKLTAAAEIANLPERDDVPGLIPVKGADHVGVVTLLDRQHPRQLWWKRIRREPTDVSPLVVGPIGPAHMVVASSSLLHCLHPLTGDVLWKRNMALEDRIYDEGIVYFGTEGQRNLQISGDDKAICVFGSRGRSCTVLDTRTGRIARVVPLNKSDRDVAVISGRMMLYPQENQLVLLDLLAGKNIIPPDAAIRIRPRTPARLLPNHRAAVISDGDELLVLDLTTGESLIRCPLGDAFRADEMVGMKIIEQGHRMFVVVRTAQDRRYEPPASSRMNDPRLERGRLFCIDTETQRVLWSRVSTASVMPPIYGDPINLLLIWSRNTTGYLDRGRRPVFGTGEVPEASLNLTVLNADTGRVLAKNHEISPSEPLRCVHTRSEKAIEVSTQNSRVTIRY